MKYLQAEQDDQSRDYQPWQRAELKDSQAVWVIRQKGDGDEAFFETVPIGDAEAKVTRIKPEQVKAWL